MSATKLLNLFALSTLAILVCSFAPSQTLALTVHPNHLARQLPNHHAVAKKKRSKRSTGQCKPRPSSSSSPPADQPTSTPQSSPSSYNTPSPSSTQSPNPVSTGTPGKSGKLGVAWALGDDPRINLILDGHNVFAFFMWTFMAPDVVKNSGARFSIMMWDDSQENINGFLQNVDNSGASFLVSCNEVNEAGQADMSPERGVNVWRNYFAPRANKGYTLVSPCTSSNPNGLDWMNEYYTQCPECLETTQATAVHYYDTTADGMQAYIEKWEAAFKLPILVTEYACQNFNGGAQPSMDQIWAFTVQIVSYLDSHPGVLSYAPFGFMDDLVNVNTDNALFNGDHLTALGQYYVNDG